MKNRLLLILLGVVFLLGLLTIILKITPAKAPTIISTAPANEAKNILDNSPISITFAETLNSKQQSQLSITTNPPTILNHTWITNSQLTTSPQRPLSTNTTYTININYSKQIIHTFQFTTNKYSTQELQQQAEQQTTNDILYNQAEVKFHQEYPWHKHLPIETQDYRITYDFTKEAFRIRLLATPSSSQQKTEFINQALKDLENVGIDLNTTKYNILEP